MINDIVNEFGKKYGPTFGGGLSNHLPMGQVALYRLIDDLEAVTILTNHYVAAAELPLLEALKMVVIDIEDELGNIDAYGAYVDFFEIEIKEKGLDQAIKDALRILYKGLIGGAFHGVIRLAYAMESNNEDEIIRALAYYASEYLALPSPVKEIKLNDLEAYLDEQIKNTYFQDFNAGHGLFTTRLGRIFSDANFEDLNIRVDDDGQVIYDVMIKYALKTYLATGDFLSLHTITGLHAIGILKSYFQDFGQVMGVYLTAYLGSLLSMKLESFEPITAKTYLKTWDDGPHFIRQTMDVHSIKFMYSCRALYEIYKLPGFVDAVNIRLGQDKMIH